MSRGNRQHKLDRNHREVLEALRAEGFSAISLAVVGGGCGDILVGWAGKNLLFEVKDGKASPSRRRLTEDEENFRLEWRGHWAVVTSAAEAIAEVRRLPLPRGARNPPIRAIMVLRLIPATG